MRGEVRTVSELHHFNVLTSSIDQDRSIDMICYQSRNKAFASPCCSFPAPRRAARNQQCTPEPPADFHGNDSGAGQHQRYQSRMAGDIKGI